MKRMRLTLTGYNNSNTKVDRRKAFRILQLFPSSRRISGLCADSLNTCLTEAQKGRSDFSLMHSRTQRYINSNKKLIAQIMAYSISIKQSIKFYLLLFK